MWQGTIKMSKRIETEIQESVGIIFPTVFRTINSLQRFVVSWPRIFFEILKNFTKIEFHPTSSPQLFVTLKQVFLKSFFLLFPLHNYLTDCETYTKTACFFIVLPTYDYEVSEYSFETMQSIPNKYQRNWIWNFQSRSLFF